MTFKTLKPSIVDPQATAQTKAIVRSPCVSVCVLNEDDVCVGCYRTGQEISRWGQIDDDAKEEILVLCRSRARELNPFL